MPEYYPPDSLIAQLMRHESYRSSPYLCPSGHRTIGYGHNLDTNQVPGVDMDSILTQDEALKLLRADAGFFGTALLVDYPWMWEMPSTRFCVFVNMAFNIGLDGFAKFRKAIAAAEARNYPRAAAEMIDSKWWNQVGNYAPDSPEGKKNGRAGRAYELVQQMRTGQWQA